MSQTATSGWWPQEKCCSLSRGEPTQARSQSPLMLLGTERGGAGVDPPASLLLSTPPVMEQEVAVPSIEFLSLLLQATSEQSPSRAARLLQVWMWQGSSCWSRRAGIHQTHQRWARRQSWLHSPPGRLPCSAQSCHQQLGARECW